MGEAFIRSKLEAYGLSITLTDADRVAPDSNVYTLPARVSLVRYIQPSATGLPLDKVDENSIVAYRSNTNVEMYCMRPTQIVFAGTPGAGAELPMQYLGMPVALATTATNQLLTDYPQLYLDAAAIYIYRRAQDYESAQIAQDSAVGFINTINRQMKKQLGGAKSANTYNTSFRSSY
jgi:hypothetical protein